MARTVSVGTQDFEQLIIEECFYIDKTDFIKEWWESKDAVTLITRPRRFGKTLNMNMLERFFSVKYKGQGSIFEGLDIWREEKYRQLQGTYPVIFLSFAGLKETTYETAVYRMCQIIKMVYKRYLFLAESDVLTEEEKSEYRKLTVEVALQDAPMALYELSDYLYRYYGRKVIILLDEYDAPLQEAYVSGYWKEMVSFTRNLFNSTFKTNPYLERAVMTGITRVSKESLFSDLNNLKVVTMASDKYASCFGFTEAEVFTAMDEFGLENKSEVKRWYDGFTIGNQRDIYNPWSIINFLDEGKLKPYWANTSSNGLVSQLVREGDKDIKMLFEKLLQGHSIIKELDEEIVFNQLGEDQDAVWSLLLASGYVTAVKVVDEEYELILTNYEVKKMFCRMVKNWFGKDRTVYNEFVRALLRGDSEEMNNYLEEMADSMFSVFDGGNKPSETKTPERFYHGFVLGLLVDLAGRYKVTSNQESGFGRYDVMLEPHHKEDAGIIIEFKVYNPKKETSLEETVQAALQQIEEKKYEQALLDGGCCRDNIQKYGFAFKGKEVLIRSSDHR